ncbi:contactin-2 isoform X1 [Synchiropus splendidus]|uniref:contactin-2 isoform X1 n=1 Tax=Synchiropus splendidus TaxID=270530 RepID=UPI00237E5E7D|nr:contactin-2 isoform X1 [Synchiropus splendidus]
MDAFVRVVLLSILAVNSVSGGDVCVAGHDSGPVFEEQPSSVIYPDGFTEGKVVLSCRARANPAASYRWIVNGTEVPLGLDSRYVPVAGNLVISRPEYQRDVGSYQCLAINRCGTIISRAAHLKFGCESRASAAPAPPVFTCCHALSLAPPPADLDDFPPDSRSPQTAYQGLGTFLACQPPPHYPALTYRWIINEFPNFIKADSGRWFVSQVTGNLYLAKAEPTDSGNYFCFPTINMDITTKSIFSRPTQLTVLPDANLKKSPPSIKVRFPAETYALAGHSAQLECFAYGNPVPRLQWRKVDGLIPSKAGASVNAPILLLPDLTLDDEGLYECEASNSEGSDVYRGRITVQAQPEWLEVMVDSEVEISSMLHWSCLAAGKPRPSVHWLRNGQPLVSQERVEVSAGSLRVSHLALEDSGMYQCVAENKHGTIYSSAELRVQVQAPEFSSNPVRKLIPAARGGQVRIECRPRAAPKPSLFWSRGTELLTNSSRVTVTPAGVLWIHNISRADEGKYTCFAENYLGKANSTGHLSVRDATKITLAPANADINQGENITLQCHASHDPTMDLTFTWALNGVLLDLEDSAGPYHRVEGRETIGDLLLVDAQLNQAGVYSCTVQTVVDSASASAKLVVRGPPGPPGGLLVRSIAESSVELCWSRGYDNHSPIGKYEIFGRSSLSAQWKQMRTEPHNIEGNAEAARVVGLVPWMDYQFQVVASNILGSGELSMPSPTIRTHQSAPAVAPSGLGGGGGDRSELIVTWTPMAREYQNGDGFGYVLEFRRKQESSWSAVRIPHVESCRFVYHNATLTPYTPFEVKIKAYNQRGEGPFSQVAVVHSAEEEPTAGPVSVNATALSAFEIQVSWDSVQDAGASGVLRGYEIRYWRQHEREAAADRVRTAGVEPSARVSGLRPSTRYHVAVLAYNSAGTGPMSPRTTVTTRKPPPNRAPGNLSWMPVGSWVSVRWDPVQAQQNESAVLGYKVLWKHEGQTALKILDKWKTSVKLPLPRDKDYVMLEVRSWGEGGDGPAQELLVSGDTGTSMMLQNQASSSSSPPPLLWGLLPPAWLLQRLSSELHL